MEAPVAGLILIAPLAAGEALTRCLPKNASALRWGSAAFAVATWLLVVWISTVHWWGSEGGTFREFHTNLRPLALASFPVACALTAFTVGTLLAAWKAAYPLKLGLMVIIAFALLAAAFVILLYFACALDEGSCI